MNCAKVQPDGRRPYLSSRTCRSNGFGELDLFDIIAIMIPIVLAVCLVIAVRILSEASVRKRMAETQSDPESIRLLLAAAERTRSRTLFAWAIGATLVGLALLIFGLFDIRAIDPLAFGLVAFAAGVALILALTVGRRL